MVCAMARFSLLRKEERQMERIKKNFYKSKYFHLVVCVALAIVAALVLLPFGRSQKQSGHDIKYHLNVIRSLSVAWDSGNFFSKIAELIGGDYGYGTGLFYSTFPAGICVFFMKTLHLPIMGALYLEMFLLFFTATVVLYFFLYRVFKSGLLAAIGAVIYLFYPYFLWNLYVRFAFTEIFLMLAIPLIVWGVYELLYRQNPRAFLPLFIIGYVLSIFSHLTMTVYVTIFLALWLLIDCKRLFKGKNVLYLAIATAVVLLITASYYVPMLVNYGVTETDTMSKTPAQMEKNTKKYFTEQILMWDYKFFVGLSVLYLLWYRFFGKGKRTTGNTAVLISSILVVFLFTHYFPWHRMPNFLRMIQYTFRVLLLGGLLASLQICILIKEVVFAIPEQWSKKQSESDAGDATVQAGSTRIQKILNKTKKIFNKRNMERILPVLILSLGLVYCGSQMIPHNKEMFSAYDKASTSATVAMDELTGRSEFYGLGAGKHGDYFPVNCKWEYVSNRLENELIADKNVKVTEIADYRALKQVSFIVPKTENGYVVLEVPYNVFDGVEVYRFRTTSSNKELKVTVESIDNGNKVRLRLANDGNESKISLSYKNAPAFKEYLEQTAFGVLTLDGDVSATNLEKSSAGKYSLDVAVGENGGVLELPSYYYKGYTLTLVKEDGGRVVVTPVHGRNGFLEAEINESGTLYVEYTSKGFAFAYVLTGVGLFAAVGVIVATWVIQIKETKKEKQS